MGYRITRYQPTPNPNALKCFLSAPISDRPKSFRKPEDAGDDAIARRLFAVPGVCGLLLSGEWMTVNKSPDAQWPAVKKAVERALGEGV
ncbi:MAG: NifU N-terminal domain-containing protein [Phycisphaerales bacterium]